MDESEDGLVDVLGCALGSEIGAVDVIGGALVGAAVLGQVSSWGKRGAVFSQMLL